MGDIFPIEVIFNILSFLDLVDVVRLRTVSKQFRDITYDASVWRHLYANSPLPRPPGPFPSQSTQFIENTLVQSAQSGHSWTTHPISDVSKTVRIGSPVLPRMIFGGWYISFESSTQIVLRNIDSESFRQVVWEHGEPSGWETLSWAVCSVAFPEGQRIYVMLSDRPYSRGKLLEFRMNVESRHMDYCWSLDIPAMSLWPSARLVGDRAPFVYLRGHRLIFDTRTRAFYRFPERVSTPDETLVLLTATHIIRITHWQVRVSLTTIQAFVIPTDLNDAHLRVLRLTHESTVQERLLPISLIRNSVTDPISGSTNLRFLGQRNEDLFTLFFCVDLTLNESRPDIVLPIFIEIQPAFKVDVPLSHVWDGNVFVEASDDGHARGFFASAVRRPRVNAGNHPEATSVDCFKFSISKFTIDASRDRCVAAVGKPLPLGWKHFTGPYLVETVFDGVRGRLYSSQLEHTGSQIILKNM